MMKRILLVLVSMLALVQLAEAQRTDRVVTKDGASYEGYICEQVPGEYIYVKTDNSITRIDWDKVEKTERLARLGQKGLLDIVLLKNGKYLKGHIVEQIIGVQMKFVLVDGTEQTIPSEDVFTIASEPSDMERSLWNQIEFLDRIYLKNGKIIEGFITSRLMGKSVIIVEKGNDEEKTVPLTDITKYVKNVNPDYIVEEEPEEPEAIVPEITFADKVNAIRLNGMVMTPVRVSKEAGGEFVIKESLQELIRPSVVQIRIMRDSTFNLDPSLIKLDQQQIYLKDKTKYPFYSQERKYKTYPVFSVVSTDEYLELTYKNLPVGYYMIMPYFEGEECAAFKIGK